MVFRSVSQCPSKHLCQWRTRWCSGQSHNARLNISGGLDGVQVSHNGLNISVSGGLDGQSQCPSKHLCQWRTRWCSGQSHNARLNISVSGGLDGVQVSLTMPV